MLAHGEPLTCAKCGSERFKAGQLELAPEGGYVVVMPCAECGHPNTAMHDDDPAFAKMLAEFFRD